MKNIEKTLVAVKEQTLIVVETKTQFVKDFGTYVTTQLLYSKKCYPNLKDSLSDIMMKVETVNLSTIMSYAKLELNNISSSARTTRLKIMLR